MALVGGSIESVILDGTEFPVAADADSNRKIGGFENEFQSNGDGSARNIKTRVPWMLSDLTIAIDDSRGDAELLQDLQDRNDPFPIVVTYASGESYQGTGGIVGETNISSQSSTTPLSLSGPGKLTPQ